MDQENVDLVISSAAIERLVEYKSKIKQYYQLHTTGIIKHAYSVSILELSSISIGSFSGKEMELFIEFFYGNPILQAIGFNDSSALFYALSKHFSIVVIDDVTKRVCNQLNIKTIRLEDVLDRLKPLEERDSYALSVENSTSKSQMNLPSQGIISLINKRRLMTG